MLYSSSQRYTDFTFWLLNSQVNITEQEFLIFSMIGFQDKTIFSHQNYETHKTLNLSHTFLVHLPVFLPKFL